MSFQGGLRSWSSASMVFVALAAAWFVALNAMIDKATVALRERRERRTALGVRPAAARAALVALVAAGDEERGAPGR